MAIKRGEVRRPILRKKAVQVGSLGGEVIVRVMLASERWAVLASDELGEDASPVAQRIAQGRRMSEMLAVCIVDDAGQSLMSADEWEMFGAEQGDDYILLINEVLRLNNLVGDAEKNSASSRS